jgi:uncharacterized protein (TIGR03435 family)
MSQFQRFAALVAIVCSGFSAISRASAQTRGSAAIAAQQQGFASGKVFAVASIRPEDPGNGLPSISGMQFSDNGFEARGVTIAALVANAYDLPATRIFGFPKWASAAHFTIHARISPDTQADLEKAGDDQRRAVHLQLLRSLLAERFHLALRVESRTTSVLLLSVAPGGPKIKRSEATSTFAATQLHRPGGSVEPHMTLSSLRGGEVGGQGIGIQDLAAALSRQLGREVRDDTGLNGAYDFDLKWTPEAVVSQNGPPSLGLGDQLPVGEPDLSLSTALTEQLGLRIKSQKVSSPVLVVDHVEEPSEN